YWVTRDPSVTGPIVASLDTLPPDVSATIQPSTLDFRGGAISELVRLTFSTIAGPTMPDTVVTLRFVGPGVGLSFPILLYGSCPQLNRNFVIRGQISYANPVEDVRPLSGAEVEIFRYRSDWFHDRVGVTSTDSGGRFSLDLDASRDGDYYARVRLFSPEVRLEDACNSSIWSFDTPHRSNSGGLIDVGSILISVNNGQGTPRAAVWQGVRNAALELLSLTKDKPATYYGLGDVKIVVFRGRIVPLTWYDEIHWAHGYQTGELRSNPQRVPTHEFAHVFRDRLDDDRAHWDADDLVHLYGRDHDYCIGR